MPFLVVVLALTENEQASVERRLDFVELKMKDLAAVTVVVAAPGYPGAYTKGAAIIFKQPPSG